MSASNPSLHRNVNVNEVNLCLMYRIHSSCKLFLSINILISEKSTGATNISNTSRTNRERKL